jgi:putative membrane protein
MLQPANIDKVRDHLANERTFLAWIRTSISIIVFGFVVAKFGITLREFLSIQNRATKDSGFSLSIGVGFMIMAIFIALLAMIRYYITMNRINSSQFKPTIAVIALLGVMTAVFGIILTIYLIFTTQTI